MLKNELKGASPEQMAQIALSNGASPAQVAQLVQGMGATPAQMAQIQAQIQQQLAVASTMPGEKRQFNDNLRALVICRFLETSTQAIVRTKL